MSHPQPAHLLIFSIAMFILFMFLSVIKKQKSSGFSKVKKINL